MQARRRRWIGALLVVVMVAAMSAFVMRPALSDCGDTIMGGTGDATSGGVWQSWLYQQEGGLPNVADTKLTAAPFGEPFWQPYYLTGITMFGMEWMFSHFVSPACAWNLSIFLGFLLSGTAMFALAYWLTRHPLASTAATIAFTLSPYRQSKAQGHLAYVHHESIVLLLLASLLVWQKPTKPRAVALALAVAWCGYSDGYYILLAGAAFAAFHLAALVYALVSKSWDRERTTRTALHVVAAGALAVVLLAPVALTLLTAGDEISAVTGRSRHELFAHSARPAEYLMPTANHPVLRRVLGAEALKHDYHGSNAVEQNLFLGWTTLALALVAVVGAVVSRRRRAEPDEPDEPADRLPLGFTAAVLGVVAVVGLLMSAPPEVTLLGVKIPMPSAAVYLLITSWRVYARFFIVVHAALVALAALGVVVLVQRRTGLARLAIAVAVIAGVVFDVLPPRRPPTFSYAGASNAYHWVRDRPERVMVEYPVISAEHDPAEVYMTYQPLHGKAMVNARIGPSFPDSLVRSIVGLQDPLTLPVLRAYGVGLVLVHTALVPPGEPPPAIPPGLRLLASFRSGAAPPGTLPAVRTSRAPTRYDDIDVYAIEPGPVAPLSVAHEGDLFYPDVNRSKGNSWMGDEGRLRVVPLNDEGRAARRAEVSFRAHGIIERRELRVMQEGVELFRGFVEPDWTPVRFTAAIGPPITLTTEPGAEPVRKYDPKTLDVRSLSIYVGEVNVTPAA